MGSHSEIGRLQQRGKSINKKRASDSYESLDARAALPQNCSLRKLNPLPISVNGPTGLDRATKVLSDD
jgi:hypothetical protein